ncbi:NAD-dependent epimerase/dehydratase family protein [Candidatus Woesearchaeota archaeon]|nr:NAD-dependent epimerase/dehydratase family protein [Candidatus Woesearchaeota archaeon]
MKILVTGATGFVGKNLMKRLERYDANILSRKETSINKANIFIGDLFDKKILLEASKVDAVIHLAGITKGDVFKANYEGTKNLVDACIENKVKKFIFVSSFNAVLNTDYGKSKLKAEEYVKNSGLAYIIFRPTVIYGRDNKKDIGKLIRLIKLGFAPVPGDGKSKLQPIFVEDLTAIITKSIESKIKNKVYFVMGGDALTFNEIVEIILKRLNKKAVRIKIPRLLVNLIDKTLLVDKVCSDNEVEKDFKFRARKFEDGIREIIP